MIKSVLRLLLVLGVLTGIVLPKSSAALAQLGLISGQVLVICTGTGLETIVLGEDGDPVETRHSAHPCLLVHATDTSTPVLPPLVRAHFASLTFQPVGSAEAPGFPHRHDARPRAPPLI